MKLKFQGEFLSSEGHPFSVFSLSYLNNTTHIHIYQLFLWLKVGECSSNSQEWQFKELASQVRNLTKRLELSFLNVFALPKASSIGLVFKISYSIPLPPPRAAKYCIAIFAVSVFPAPLSPLNMQMKIIMCPNSNAIKGHTRLRKPSWAWY